MAETPDNLHMLDTGHRAETLPKPPAGLSENAQFWWNEIVAEFTINDSAGKLLLETAMRCFDRLNEASEILNREGLTVTDRYMQTKQHPCAAIERDQRAQLLASFKALSLDLEVGKMFR